MSSSIPLTNPSFPLLKLPYLAVRGVLKNMTYIDIIHFSMVSLKCKVLIKFPINTTNAVIYNEKVRLETDDEDVIEELVTGTEAFNIRVYLDQILDVFKCQNLEIIFSRESETINFECVQKTFQGLDVNGVTINSCSAEWNRSILDEYPTMKNLYLIENRLTEKEFEEKVWSKHLTSLTLVGGFNITLEKVKYCKASNLDVTEFSFSGAQLNSFLKSWIDGSNPDLESMSVATSQWTLYQDFANQVFDGILYTKAPENQDRRFYRKLGGLKNTDFKGGYDFERKDGTKATLLAKRLPGSLQIIFMVWK